jgi:hypothetical protein
MEAVVAVGQEAVAAGLVHKEATEALVQMRGQEEEVQLLSEALVAVIMVARGAQELQIQYLAGR